MKNKLKFLTKDSLKKKIGTKWFKIINIILLITIPCLINLDSVIKFFGGDFNDLTNIYIIDEANIYEELKQTMDNSYLSILENYNAQIIKATKTEEEITKEIKEEKLDDIIILINKSENIFDAKIISYDPIDTILYQNITNALNTVKTNKALLESNIDLKELEKIYESVEISRTLLNEKLNENEELMKLIGVALIAVFILPFFFLVIIIVQMIGAEINEEKSSKSMEIIISSVPPKTHFLSKLFAANLFAIIQGTLLIIYCIIGIVLKGFTTNIPLTGEITESLNISGYLQMFMQSNVLNTLLIGIPFFIIILLLSFFAYSLLTGILASMTTNMEDYQQIQTPIMILLMIGYYLAIIATTYEGATFIHIASYIPFISGILAPVLYTLGQITILELIISILLLLITCVFLYKYGLKIYKVGILNYSSNKLWSKIFKSLKE